MNRRISAPFFEIGPKTFLNRAELLEIANAAAKASHRFQVDVIFTPPALDIEAVKATAPDLWVFAQAMDAARAGLSTGAITPEALKSVGADGVMLNHAERPLSDEQITSSLARAADVDLATLLCVDNLDQARRFAASNPDIILVEPHDLIGTAHHSQRPWIRAINEAIANINPQTLVMHSGGIADESDVRAVIAQGAAGTGCTSAIINAAEKRDMVTRMIRAVRQAWDARAEPLVFSILVTRGLYENQMLKG